MTPTHLEPKIPLCIVHGAAPLSRLVRGLNGDNALPSSTRDTRTQAVIDAHGGDAEAALLTTLHEIDRLYARLEAISLDVSVGYCHGRWRRAAAYAARNTGETLAPQALDV